MFRSVKFAVYKKSEGDVTIKLYDKYPTWSPWEKSILSNVTIEVKGPGISIKGAKHTVDFGSTGYVGYTDREISNPEEYEDGHCEKRVVTKWRWFKRTEREAYFATRNWITKKLKPEI